MCVCVYVCVRVCVRVLACGSVSVYWSARVSDCVSVCIVVWFLSLSLYLSLCLGGCVCVFVSVCPSLSLCACLSGCVSVCPACTPPPPLSARTGPLRVVHVPRLGDVEPLDEQLEQLGRRAEGAVGGQERAHQVQVRVDVVREPLHQLQQRRALRPHTRSGGRSTL